MESFADWGFLGLFLASFLGATIIPKFRNSIKCSFSKGYDFNVSIIIATIGNWLGD